MNISCLEVRQKAFLAGEALPQKNERFQNMLSKLTLNEDRNDEKVPCLNKDEALSLHSTCNSFPSSQTPTMKLELLASETGRTITDNDLGIERTELTNGDVSSFVTSEKSNSTSLSDEKQKNRSLTSLYSVKKSNKRTLVHFFFDINMKNMNCDWFVNYN